MGPRSPATPAMHILIKAMAQNGQKFPQEGTQVTCHVLTKLPFLLLVQAWSRTGGGGSVRRWQRRTLGSGQPELQEPLQPLLWAMLVTDRFNHHFLPGSKDWPQLREISPDPFSPPSRNREFVVVPRAKGRGLDALNLLPVAPY